MRYIRFGNAAVPSDTELDDAPKAPRGPSPKPQLFWALNPFRGKFGTYVAIRLKGDDIQVGIRSGDSLTWVSADKALSKEQALVWFSRAKFHN